MRLGHLTDHEIQAYVDRKRCGTDNTRGDRLAEKHLKSCALCAAIVEEYKELDAAVRACPVPPLSAGFTARVISRLPASGELWGMPLSMSAAVLSPIAALVTVLLKVNLDPVLGLLVAMVVKQYIGLRVWWNTFSIPALPRPSLSLDWGFLNQLQTSIAEPSKVVVLLLLVSVTLLMFASVEKLVFGKAYRRW